MVGLGYHFSPAGLTVAKQTITNFIEKASQLYEQERRADSAVPALEVYVRQWLKWARAGVLERVIRTRSSNTRCILTSTVINYAPGNHRSHPTSVDLHIHSLHARHCWQEILQPQEVCPTHEVQIGGAQHWVRWQ